MDLENVGIEVGEYITITDEESNQDYEYLVMYIFEIEDRTYLCLYRGAGRRGRVRSGIPALRRYRHAATDRG